MYKFFHSFDVWMPVSAFVVFLIMYFITRKDRHALTDSIPQIARDLKQDKYDGTKPVASIGITDECFEKLKRTGETEVMEGPDAIVSVSYLQTKPAASWAGRGCYLLKEKP